MYPKAILIYSMWEGYLDGRSPELSQFVLPFEETGNIRHLHSSGHATLMDTQIICHLLQEDVPEKMADTRKLWEKFKVGQYDVYLSTVTLEEISDCKEPKKSQMYRYLKQINYTPIQSRLYYQGHPQNKGIQL